MHGRRRPRRTFGLLLPAVVLWAAYTPHPSIPEAPARAPTFTTRPTPARGLVCALRGEGAASTSVPTAGHGPLERVAARYGGNACASDGAFDRFSRQAQGMRGDVSLAAMPRLAGRAGEP